jgi:hypothetical protein
MTNRPIFCWSPYSLAQQKLIVAFEVHVTGLLTPCDANQKQPRRSGKKHLVFDSGPMVLSVSE